MENSESTIKKNLRQSMIITFASFLIGAILFLISYIYIKNIWFLVLTIVSFVAGIVFIFVIKSLESRYLPAINQQKKENAK